MTTLPTFGFATATEISFGRGAAHGSIARIATFGRNALVVTGATSDRAGWLIDELKAEGVATAVFSVPKEPDVDLISAGIAAAQGCDVVIAIGGGAAIDAGKAIAALVPAQGDMMDYLEVVGKGLPLETNPLPFVAIPTTAGTGAEATRNAVINVPSHRRKVSLRDVRMLPRLAIVDPALTDNCPKPITLASGLDAVTQVIEPYICSRANPMTDALCRDAIPRGMKALARLMENEDPAARNDMALTSLYGGIALANAGLGVVHGLAGPLGGLSNAAHGAICGALLPHGLAMNDAQCGGHPRIAEVRQWIADALGCDTGIAFENLEQWSKSNGLLGLDALGVSEEDRHKAAQDAATSSSMKANPVALTSAHLAEIMEKAR